MTTERHKQEEHKQLAAQAALTYIQDNTLLGVGTGSTVNYLIDLLSPIKHRLQGTVASSEATASRLRALGIPVFDLNTVPELPLYIDGADAYNSHRQLVKGGGGALTREKILAHASETFVCIADESKATAVFGEYPIAVEVIPMARSYVAREIIKLGGLPVYRQGFLTDNGNVILDIHHLVIYEPLKLEHALNNIAGVLCNGLFMERPADVLLIGGTSGVQEILSPCRIKP